VSQRPDAANRARGGPAGAQEAPRGRRRIADAVVGVASVLAATAAVVVVAALLSLAVAAVAGSF